MVVEVAIDYVYIGLITCGGLIVFVDITSVGFLNGRLLSLKRARTLLR